MPPRLSIHLRWRRSVRYASCLIPTITMSAIEPNTNAPQVAGPIAQRYFDKIEAERQAAQASTSTSKRLFNKLRRILD